MFNHEHSSSSNTSHPTISSNSSLFKRIISSENYIIITVAFGLLVDMATYGIMVPVLPFRLHNIGYPKVAATSSYLIAAFALGLIISSIPISILGEIIKKRKISLKIPLLVCLLFLAGSLILFWLSTSLPVLLIARVFQGFSGTGIWTLGLALICEVVPEHRLGVVMGYVMIGWSIGTIIGPLAGGLLYDSLGYHSIFVFALILTGIDFTLRMLVSDKEAIKNREASEAARKELVFTTLNQSKAESASEASSLKNDNATTAIPKEVQGKESDATMAAQTPYASSSTQTPSTTSALCSLIFSARVWTLCAIIFVLGFTFGGLLDSGMTLIVHARYGLNSRGAGLVFIGAVVPSFASSPLAGYFADKYGARWPTIICLIIGTPFFGLMSMEGSLATFVVWIAMTGLFVMAIAAPIMQDLAEVVKITPGLGYAHVYGIFNMIYSTGALVGPLVVGVILQRLGIQPGWRLVSLISALLCALCVIPAWLYIPSKKFDKLITKSAAEGKPEGSQISHSSSHPPQLPPI